MIYFFSDVHLGLGERHSSRAREECVVRFLEKVRRDRVERLFIVGDLFDYWFDYRTAIPRDFVRTLGALAQVTDNGIPVDYVIGNHDFGHRDFFRAELGVVLHTADVEMTLAGRRCFVSHGDGKVLNDTGYRILKSVLRARPSRFLYRMLHPDIGIGIASFASHRSRAHSSAKHYGGERPGESDGLYLFAEQKIVADGFDLVVMGHSHVARRVDFASGTYVNLGSWLGDDRHYLTLDQDLLELRKI